MFRRATGSFRSRSTYCSTFTLRPGYHDKFVTVRLVPGEAGPYDGATQGGPMATDARTIPADEASAEPEAQRDEAVDAEAEGTAQEPFRPSERAVAFGVLG